MVSPITQRLSVKLHLRDGRTDGQSVRPSVRFLDGVWHLWNCDNSSAHATQQKLGYTIRSVNVHAQYHSHSHFHLIITSPSGVFQAL